MEAQLEEVRQEIRECKAELQRLSHDHAERVPIQQRLVLLEQHKLLFIQRTLGELSAT